MPDIELMMTRFLLASARFAPVFAVPALTPFAWVPVLVRVVLLIAVSALAAAVAPMQVLAVGIDQPLALGLALLGECLLGLTLAVAVMLPATAIAFSARVADVQSGMAAVDMFNPAASAGESMTGTAMRWAVTLVFFALGLHMFLLRWVIASTHLAPLGSAVMMLSPERFMVLLGGQFTLGLAVVAPVILGLLGVDIAVAFASRSMPQANIYFVALPLKVAAAFLLLAADLKFVPELVGRVFEQAFRSISFGGVP